MAEFIRIKGWEQYQHYKDRNPPWIKLHQEMLTGQTWIMGNDHQKALMITVMLLAARTDNCIPANPAYIKKVAHLDVDPDLGWLCSTGFCELTDKPELRESPWPSRYISAELREVVFARDGHRCCMCQSRDKLEVDHVIPVSKGGQSKVDNLQTLCRSCNRKKRARMAILVDGVAIATENIPLRSTKTEAETETEQSKKKIPASPKARGTPNASQVAKAQSDSRHNRSQQLVMGWYREWAGIECPWDGGEARQLSNLLKAWPGVSDAQFVMCLENVAHSDCIPKGDRPREWLGKLPKFVNGALDQFWKAKGIGNGNGTRSVSKADARERRAVENILKYRTATAGAGNPAGDGPVAVPRNGATGVCGLDGEPEIVSPGKDPSRSKSPDG